ncbi:MAG: hypothetical protein ABMB14_06470 [Myxococcota bacterium]
MDKLPKLPGMWEIGVAESDNAGPIVVVVDATTGDVRFAQPWDGDDLGRLLLPAFDAPVAPAVPGRPTGIRCGDTDLVRNLGAALGGIAPILVGNTPSLEAFVEHLRSEGASPSPGFTVELDAWRDLLPRLLELAPWAMLGDAVEFWFEGPGFDGLIGVFLGDAGQPAGFGLTREQDIDGLRVEDGDEDSGIEALATAELTTLTVTPSADVAPGYLAACRALGLEFDGQVPLISRVVNAVRRPPDEDQQRLLLAAVIAALALVEANGADLLGILATSTVDTPLGPIEVSAGVGDVPDVLESLIPYDHLVLFGTYVQDDGVVPALFLKLAKYNAKKVEAQLQRVDQILLLRDEDDGMLTMVGLSGHDAVGVVARVEPNDLVVRQLVDGGVGCLVLASGGTSKPRISPWDVMWANPVVFAGG